MPTQFQLASEEVAFVESVAAAGVQQLNEEQLSKMSSMLHPDQLSGTLDKVSSDQQWNARNVTSGCYE